MDGYSKLMWHKLRRAARIRREEGTAVIAKKAMRYLPIEVDNVFYRLRHGSPSRVMDEDWDNLLILDACRYDMFEDQCTLSGELEHRISLGSTSEEFLVRNFGSETFHDTVYVNTNPYLPYTGLDDGTFHAVVDLLEEWDEELQTVRPETVVNAALEAHNEYPDKRLIVHFMQPHYPFIGDTGRKMESRGWNPKNGDIELDGNSVWQQLRKGVSESDAAFNLDLVWKAYRENLDIVLDSVANLTDTLDGKSVITADHGNLVGERLFPLPTRRKYGHPLGVYHPSLVKVPWFIVEDGERRSVTAEAPSAQETLDSDVTAERLAALGYK